MEHLKTHTWVVLAVCAYVIATQHDAQSLAMAVLFGLVVVIADVGTRRRD